MHKLSTEYIRQARRAKATSKGGRSKVQWTQKQRRALADLRAIEFGAHVADDLRYALRANS